MIQSLVTADPKEHRMGDIKKKLVRSRWADTWRVRGLVQVSMCAQKHLQAHVCRHGMYLYGSMCRWPVYTHVHVCMYAKDAISSVTF